MSLHPFLVLFLWFFFLFALPYSDLFLIYLIIFSYSLDACFLMGSKKGVDLEGEGDGEKLGGIERGEILIRIQCMKIFIFNKGKKKRRKSLTGVPGHSSLS